MNILLLGERLRACRIARQQTMREFAELLGISERYLADIERGVKAPRLDTFVRIVNTLGISTEYLLQDSLTSDQEPGIRIQNAIVSLPKKQQALIENFILDLAKSLK